MRDPTLNLINSIYYYMRKMSSTSSYFWNIEYYFMLRVGLHVLNTVFVFDVILVSNE